jgi:hypothetical protein
MSSGAALTRPFAHQIVSTERAYVEGLEILINVHSLPSLLRTLIADGLDTHSSLVLAFPVCAHSIF